ncbi:hypothetical protein [Buttiauxella brennerae]|uniref:hypothetical protein n=1 Tax=Buttiauxella brennerae TaxID=82988 RepID=UPI00286EE2C1|nr:hypothetical protein [Buttiauxella brennerae]
MRKIPSAWIRRGDGLTERVILRLSKSPATHSELVNLFGDVFRNRIKDILRPKKSYEIKAGYWHLNKEGENDRTYTLCYFSPGKQTSKTKRNQNICISKRSLKQCNEHSHAEYIRQAKLRAKLIKIGGYSELEEKKLCGK